mmetsp:Transcript_49442/g.137043  ORF Transcript_49442/g.137043 Transcript_49442/m.137043 type:complete len:218 (+) Transcript_49442:315-968(+)|eukprot:2849269-Prymnesium_polylepis.3
MLPLEVLIVSAGEVPLHVHLARLLRERALRSSERRLRHGRRWLRSVRSVAPPVEALPHTPWLEHGADVAAACKAGLVKAGAGNAEVNRVSNVRADVGRNQVRSHVVGEEDIARLAGAMHDWLLEQRVGLFCGQVVHALVAQLVERAFLCAEVRRKRVVAAWVHDKLTRHGLLDVAEQHANEHIKVVDRAVVVGLTTDEVIGAAVDVPALADAVKVRR